MKTIFEITGDYIELVKLLKASGVCDTGGNAPGVAYARGFEQFDQLDVVAGDFKNGFHRFQSVVSRYNPASALPFRQYHVSGHSHGDQLAIVGFDTDLAHGGPCPF